VIPSNQVPGSKIGESEKETASNRVCSSWIFGVAYVTKGCSEGGSEEMRGCCRAVRSLRELAFDVGSKKAAVAASNQLDCSERLLKGRRLTRCSRFLAMQDQSSHRFG